MKWCVTCQKYEDARCWRLYELVKRDKCSFCEGMGDLHQNPDIPCPYCGGTGQKQEG